MLKNANILVTGGAGTLGRAIARRRSEEEWRGHLTVYSTNPEHHQIMRRMYPDVNYVQGDIRNPDTMYNSIVGHDVVIHAAAVKYIPDSEYASMDTIDVNVYGSEVVARACVNAGVKHVLAISTDKACHPANLYGCTKMAMEKVWQEYSRADFETQFHLVRYGNVLESTGSVIETWKKTMQGGYPIKITDPGMTRFWLSPSQAVDMVVESLKYDSGMIYIPKMPSLSIGKLAHYTIGIQLYGTEGEAWPTERIPLRPGEKTHETLLTLEELSYAREINTNGDFLLGPTTGTKTPKEHRIAFPYSSDVARTLTKKELFELLDD